MRLRGRPAVSGQATAFKIGMQVILDLRVNAEQRLGNAFDPRAFHALVLENGPLAPDLVARRGKGVDLS